MTRRLAPSILSCDLTRLGEELVTIQHADWVHVDVMDGQFVPNISFGLPIVQAVRKASSLFVDVHLMIEQPERYLAEFAHAGADGLTIQIESTRHAHRAITQIKELGKKAGIALNPGTALETVRPLLKEIDLVLIMSVNPGFGGQTFIPQSIERIQIMRQWLDEMNSQAYLQVDGGVTVEHVQTLTEAGADVLVAGSAIFNANGAASNVRLFREAMS